MRGLVLQHREGTLAELRPLLAEHLPCDAARTVEQATQLLRSGGYDLVVLDHHPPASDATRALTEALAAAPDAMVILFGAAAEATRHLVALAPDRVLSLGGAPGDLAELPVVAAELARIVELRRQQHELVRKLGAAHLRLKNRERLLDVVVRERTRELELACERLRQAHRQTLLSLAEAIEAKDPYTKGHCGRVAAYALALADVMRFPSEQMETVEFSAFLHDIGKIGVRDAVLLKPGALDEAEWQHMRIHPVVGDTIASQVDLLKPLRPAIRNHHERWDGRGYPDGLAGDHIPTLARVVAIADAFDAMVTDRPYKRAISLGESHVFLRKGAGAQFDPELVELFITKGIGEQFVAGDG